MGKHTESFLLMLPDDFALRLKTALDKLELSRKAYLRKNQERLALEAEDRNCATFMRVLLFLLSGVWTWTPERIAQDDERYFQKYGHKTLLMQQQVLLDQEQKILFQLLGMSQLGANVISISRSDFQVFEKHFFRDTSTL